MIVVVLVLLLRTVLCSDSCSCAFSGDSPRSASYVMLEGNIVVETGLVLYLLVVRLGSCLACHILLCWLICFACFPNQVDGEYTIFPLYGFSDGPWCGFV